MNYGPIEALERRRGTLAQAQENSARLAGIFTTYTTTGQGQFLLAREMIFNAPFALKPNVTYCPVFENMAGFTIWPRCNGWPRSWTQDAKGMYTGAHMAVTVDSAPGVLGNFQYVVEHHFGFWENAIKALPAHLLA